MTVRPLLLAAVLAVAAALAGCGTASSPSPPTGVDELRIPTPSPDPDDFVAAVDNPWFPLPHGASWVYAVTGADGSHRMTVTAEPGPRIAGVATTSRVSSEPSGVVTDWFAQDDDGNVWWFGREGSWRAGEGGAEAGIAMLAHPRIGDGYRMAYAQGVVEDTAQVTALDGEAHVAAGQYDDLVEIEQTSALDSGATGELAYGRGVGLVEASTTAPTYRQVRLVSAPDAITPPAA